MIEVPNRAFASGLQELPSPVVQDWDHAAVATMSIGPESAGSAADTSHGLLLVVDDDETNCDLLSSLLKRQGYAVAIAKDGRQALEMLRETPFDLVLLDIMMPEMDGFEVLKRLKKDELLQKIPVIMISALSEGDSAVRCIELGAEDFLPKPFDPILLKARTVACLEKKRAQDAAARLQAETITLNERLRQAMRETHHRVKNNLQVISAIVDLQLMKDADTISADEFRRVGTSVRALAAVHDLLTQQTNVVGESSSISAKALIEKLLALLQQTVGVTRIRSKIDEGHLAVRQGGSLALVLNELISNAVKHGAGDVEVLYTVGKASAVLSVCDNGRGFAEGFDPLVATGTGLDLIMNLSRWDLGGKVTFENQPSGGACVSVTIPLDCAGAAVAIGEFA